MNLSVFLFKMLKDYKSMRIVLTLFIIQMLFSCSSKNEYSKDKTLKDFNFKEIEDEKLRIANVKELEIKTYYINNSGNNNPQIEVCEFDSVGNKILVHLQGFMGSIEEYKYENNRPVKLRASSDTPPYCAIIKYTVDSNKNTIIQKYIKIMKSEWEKDDPDTIGTLWQIKYIFNHNGQLIQRIYEEPYSDPVNIYPAEYIYDSEGLLMEKNANYLSFKLSVKYFYKKGSLGLIEEYRDDVLSEKKFFNREELVDSVYFYNEGKLEQKAYYSYKKWQ